MMKKPDSVLKEVLEKIKPSEKEIKEMEISAEEVLYKIKKKINSLKIKADIFIGGSFAKHTVIKKDKYDVDIFLRFDKKYQKDISELTEKILKGVKNVLKIHGSRDYFRIKIKPGFFVEIIPVIKVKNPKESDNITDLSYSHVRYINKKIKNTKISDEILLAKSFCHAHECYGAESYIQGFSGYSLELLVYHYGSFLKFLKAMAKFNLKDKLVIDLEKLYKNKQEVLMDMNSSKLQSPLILVDPTYKQRNATAALSREMFEKFQKACKSFLKNPCVKFFEQERIDLEKTRENSSKKKFEFILLKTETSKQEGDVAGSKLLKFYNHLSKEIERFFEIKERRFEYSDGKSARYFFVVKPRKEILFDGPNVKDLKNCARFKKEHKKTYVRKSKLYAKEKISWNIKDFIRKWKSKNSCKIKDMSILSLKIV